MSMKSNVVTLNSAIFALVFFVGGFVIANTPAAPPAHAPVVRSEAPALDVPFVPTPQPVVDKMLEMARVKKGDQVYDLGCGDGRIVVTAAKRFGARGVGIDLDPDRVRESKQNVRTNRVGHLVEIREGDALKADLSSADVITLYLLPSVNLQLRESLQKLKPGTRIVSHDFDMGDWEPLRTEIVRNGAREHTVYLWEIGRGARKDLSSNR